MKPGEFDEQVRQKFAQNDFAFNPNNWERLAEKLDGKVTKRSTIIWWLPMVGIAAAVTVAMGFGSYLQHAGQRNEGGGGFIGTFNKIASNNTPVIINQKKEIIADVVSITLTNLSSRAKKTKNNRLQISQKQAEHQDQCFNIKLANALNGNVVKNNNSNTQTLEKPDLANLNSKFLVNSNSKANIKKETTITSTGTFIYPQTLIAPVEKREPIASIILNGGINYGDKNTGFMLGATGRRMITDKVFIESDIAFTGSNNIQKTASLIDNTGYVNGRLSSSTRTTSNNDIPVTPPKTDATLKVVDQAYNLYYAQVTPSIGYKLMKKMSIGFGADFQQALSDNRPPPATLDRGNVQVAPMFDIGFIGKTEFTLSDKVKAAILYREGVNNIITPMNKYTERNYVQFQIKYAIFNK